MAQFLYSKWLDLPLPTRQAIATLVGVAKIRPTHVIDNRVADDGFPIKEIEARLSTETMQDLLGTTESDHAVLFDMLIAKAEGRTYEQPTKMAQMSKEDANQAREEYEERTGQEAPVIEPVVVPKKPGRKPKAK